MTPDQGELYMYKELGGINWCLCKVIAIYEGKVWLHNLHSGSMPTGPLSRYEFKSAQDYLIQI